MFNSKYSNFLTVLLVIAIIGIIILLGYFGWSVYHKNYVDTSAGDAADEFENNVGNKDNNKDDNKDDGNRIDIGDIENGNSLYGKPSSRRE